MRLLLFIIPAVALWYVARRTMNAAQRVTSPRPAVPLRPVAGYCADCDARVALNLYSRCSRCDSGAIAVTGNAYGLGVSGHA